MLVPRPAPGGSHHRCWCTVAACGFFISVGLLWAGSIAGMSRGWRGPLAVAGWVLAAAYVASVVVALVWGLFTAESLGLLGVAVGLVLTWSAALLPLSRAGRIMAGTAQMDTAADKLARAVYNQWTHEATVRSLNNPDPMPVRWRFTHRAVMDPPEENAGGALSFTGGAARPAEVAQWLRGLKRRRLVILGGPGAGKTTLAIQLVLQLSKPETRRAGDPVPVVFPVTGWDTATYPRLKAWLAARLAKDYPLLRGTALGPDTAGSLVENRQILPVLDGLDELPGAFRAMVILEINTYFADEEGVILTSRTDEYSDAVVAGQALESAAVIEPDPLTPSDTATYLRRYLRRYVPAGPGPAWEQVLTALGTGTAGPLSDVLVTPLNVWLLREVYITNGRDPAPLLGRRPFPDTTAIRTHLFDQFISSVLTSRGPGTDAAEPFRARHRWKPDDTRRWLGYLATQLTQHNTRDIAWWHLARHTIHPTKAITFKRAARAAASGGCSAPSWLNDEPGYADLKRGLARGVPLGLGVGIWPGFAVVFFGLVAGAEGGIGGGIARFALGLSAAIPFAVMAAAMRPALTSKASTPGSSWRADRTLTLLRTLALALTSGLFAWPMGGSVARLLALPVSGLAVGLTAGLTAGLVFGLVIVPTIEKRRAWMVNGLAALYLASTRRLPWRLMAFLDDAHRVGLLRAVGPMYQFRHADLHDHLAANHTTNQAPAPPPGSPSATK